MKGTNLGNTEIIKMKKTHPHSKRARAWADGEGGTRIKNSFVQNVKHEFVNFCREMPG